MYHVTMHHHVPPYPGCHETLPALAAAPAAPVAGVDVEGVGGVEAEEAVGRAVASLFTAGQQLPPGLWSPHCLPLTSLSILQTEAATL